MFALNYATEIKWVMRLFKDNNCRTAFCQGDPNFLNPLVKTGECAEHESKVVLIDYEGAMYGFRGTDIGGHFVNRMLHWRGQSSKVSGSPFPVEGERRIFCGNYVQAKEKLGHQLSEWDTVDHMMLEADIGALFYSCATLIWIVKNLDHLIQEPAFLTAFQLLLDFYGQQKQIVKQIQ